MLEGLVQNQVVSIQLFSLGQLGAGDGALFGHDREQRPQQRPGLGVLDGQVDDERPAFVHQSAEVDGELSLPQRVLQDGGEGEQAEAGEGRIGILQPVSLREPVVLVAEERHHVRVRFVRQAPAAEVGIGQQANQGGQGQLVGDEHLDAVLDQLIEPRRCPLAECRPGAVQRVEDVRGDGAGGAVLGEHIERQEPAGAFGGRQVQVGDARKGGRVAVGAVGDQVREHQPGELAVRVDEGGRAALA